MAKDIREEMPLDELYEWAAFFELKYEAEKKAVEQAKKSNGRR